MAKKDKKKGSAVNQLEVIQVAKEHFLSLCLMFEAQGRRYKSLAKVMGHPQFSKLLQATTIPADMGTVLCQYKEIGEEMKNIGAALDLCGGKSCMKQEDPKLEKKEDEGTFVNNVEPKKDDKEL